MKQKEKKILVEKIRKNEREMKIQSLNANLELPIKLWKIKTVEFSAAIELNEACVPTCGKGPVLRNRN